MTHLKPINISEKDVFYVNRFDVESIALFGFLWAPLASLFMPVYCFVF